MDRLTIAPTDFTPGVDFNPDTLNFRLWGVSRPEDVRSFYSQIISWLADLEHYYSGKAYEGLDSYTIKMEFRLDYFNSSSAKLIIDLLNQLKQFRKHRFHLEVSWYYDAGDEQMHEDAEELAEACNLEFQFYGLS